MGAQAEVEAELGIKPWTDDGPNLQTQHPKADDTAKTSAIEENQLFSTQPARLGVLSCGEQPSKQRGCIWPLASACP